MTWGYIKEATLTKLDLDVKDAIEIGFVNKFYIYANEAMSQICSAVKPKTTFANFKVANEELLICYLKDKYKITNTDFLNVSKFNIEDLKPEQRAFYDEYIQYVFTEDVVKMPNDFISFDVGYKSYMVEYLPYIASNGRLSLYKKHDVAFDNDYILYGAKSIKFKRPGDYNIAYNALWFLFSPTTDDSTEIDAPIDVLQCLPSYIVSQCFKIDDEEKAAIYRNEYEMFLARVDNSDDMQGGTFTIGGDW